jgi:hypothetical protein
MLLLSPMKMLLLGIGLSLGATMTSRAAESHFESSAQQAVLVELYTSEGCSSCPPAEAWLSRLKDNPRLWKQFVPVAFHVDYWDRLGWRDRFSSKQWTERQSRYAALWKSDSVYTPGVVMNGREQRGWSGADLSQPNDNKPGVLRVTTNDGKNFAIGFQSEKGTGKDWEVHLALLGCGISSNVRAGENSGRNLSHDFVVLDLQNAEMKSDSGTAHASLTSSATIERGARKAVAVWVTAGGQLVPVQATGGWLP